MKKGHIAKGPYKGQGGGQADVFFIVCPMLALTQETHPSDETIDQKRAQEHMKDTRPTKEEIEGTNPTQSKVAIFNFPTGPIPDPSYLDIGEGISA